MKDVLQKAKLLIVALSLLSSAWAMAQGGRVPIVRNVGIIPVVWQGDSGRVSSIARAKSLILSGFSSIARSSHRFQFLNDTIVASSWQTAEGRSELVDEFELEAFLSLTITEQGDLLIFTVRMLSPQLENYLVESDRISKNWLIRATDQAVTLRVKSLVFRLMNRYPIDVYVTSIQGSYVTLSSGRKQNIYEGDQLDFYEINIEETHPVNGSWIRFSQKRLGNVKIIDAKTHSSIGRLSSLEFEGAIGVGAAAKITQVDSRRLFRNIARDEDSQSKERLVEVQPLESARNKEQGDGPTQKMADAELLEPQQKAPPEVDEGEEDAGEEPEMVPLEEAEPMDVDDGPGFMESAKMFLADHFKTIHFTTGYRSWTIEGSSPAASKFPFWLINHMEGWGEIPFDDQKQVLRLGTAIGAGSTESGNFFRLALNVDYTIKNQQQSFWLPFMDFIEFGVFTELSTSQLASEAFGGYDAALLGGLFRFGGRYHMVDEAQTIDIEGAARLRVLGAGQAGLAGKTRTISGVLGYTLEALALHKRPDGSLEWGGFLRYDSNSFTLNADKLSESSAYFGLLLRKRF